MLISHAHFPIPSLPTHHHLHARGVFMLSTLSLPLCFIITLNLTTITLRPVKRENQLNSHFLLHRLPFYVSFFSFVVYSSSRWLVCWIASLSFSMCVLFVLLFCVSLLTGSATATIRSGSLTFNHLPHSTKSKEEKKKITSQGYNKPTIAVRSRRSYLTKS
jgi:hypothetical protein